MLFLTFFAFGVAACDFFSNVKHGFYINDNGNFKTTFNSIVMLIRMSTGENWNGVMRDCAVEPPDCDPDKLDNCGNQLFSLIFFPVFMFIVSFIMIAMVSAVIMDQFEEKRVPKVVDAKYEDFEDASITWSIESRLRDDFLMHVSHLPQFLANLPSVFVPPVARSSYSQMSEFIKQLNIPMSPTKLTKKEDEREFVYVHYIDVMCQLYLRGKFFSSLYSFLFYLLFILWALLRFF
jgi:hypothetical protein